jgi:hypothetical protein
MTEPFMYKLSLGNGFGREGRTLHEPEARQFARAYKKVSSYISMQHFLYQLGSPRES